MSEFDYGFGAANADRILAEAEYRDMNVLERTAEDAATKAKVAFRTMVSNFENAVRERNNKIAQIKALPDSEYKKAKIKEFNDIDKGGWLSPSFTSQVNAMKLVLSKLGVDSSVPPLETLGIVPIATLVALPTAAWVAASVVAVSAAALATYFATYGVRMAGILINPEAVKAADPTLVSSIGERLGEGLKYAVILAGIGGVAYFVMKGRK